MPVLPDRLRRRAEARDRNLWMIDGIALDVHGTIYAALIGQRSRGRKSNQWQRHTIGRPMVWTGQA